MIPAHLNLSHMSKVAKRLSSMGMLVSTIWTLNSDFCKPFLKNTQQYNIHFICPGLTFNMNMIFGRHHHHPNHSSSPSALIMFTQEPLTLESGESPWFPLLSSLRDIWPSSCVFVNIYKENKEFIRDDLFYFFLTNFAPKVENKLFKRGKAEKESEFFSILLHNFQCWQMDYNLQCIQIAKSIQFEIFFHLSTLL